MNEQDLATRKELAEAHRRVQRFEGDIISRELEINKTRNRSIRMSLNYYEQKCHEKERTIQNLRRQLKSRSWLERLLGVERGN